MPDGSRLPEPGGSSTASPASPEFDDSAWRQLNIPHDGGIEGSFRYDIENITGKLPGRGIG